MGQIANQVLIELIARLKDKYREKQAAKKEKACGQDKKNR